MDISFEPVKTGLLGSQPKILLVEDNFANRDMLMRRLRRQGFEVCCAADGVSGRERCLPNGYTARTERFYG